MARRLAASSRLWRPCVDWWQLSYLCNRALLRESSIKLRLRGPRARLPQATCTRRESQPQSVMCQPWDMVTLTDISALEKMGPRTACSRSLARRAPEEGLPWGETQHAAAVHHVNLPALGTCLSADAPAHVLVSSPRERVRSGTVVSHVWSGPLPDRSLFRLSDDVLMASPGLVLAQMATSTPLPELAAVVMEMCGRYGRVRWSSRGFLDRKPLTTPQNLREYLCSLPGHLCIQRAERATQFALVGSRSPLETSFALMGQPARGTRRLPGLPRPMPQLSH